MFDFLMSNSNDHNCCHITLLIAAGTIGVAVHKQYEASAHSGDRNVNYTNTKMELWTMMHIYTQYRLLKYFSMIHT